MSKQIEQHSTDELLAMLENLDKLGPYEFNKIWPGPRAKVDKLLRVVEELQKRGVSR